jgi:tripartite motif-containing protein 71
MKKQKGAAVIVSFFLAVALLAAGCSFPARGEEEPEPQASPRLVDEEGYTQVEVLAVLEGEPLHDPAGVAVTAGGEILVSDGARHQIYRYSPEGELIDQLGSQGGEPGRFNQPGALSLDGKGNIYVADVGNNRVQVLDAGGRFLRQVGSRDEFASFFSLQDGFDIPLAGLAADREGNIYLALKGAYYDISENELRKYTPDGELVMQLASMLEGSYDLVPFTWPGALTVDGEGTIYLVHGANGVGKVIKIPLEQNGPIADQTLQFGSLGKGKGELLHTPLGVAVDREGNIYVSDTHNNRVQVYDSRGEWLLMFRLAGTPYGELTEPGNLAVDGEGNLYVVDRGNARVLKIANPVRHGSVG